MFSKKKGYRTVYLEFCFLYICRFSLSVLDVHKAEASARSLNRCPAQWSPPSWSHWRLVSVVGSVMSQATQAHFFHWSFLFFFFLFINCQHFIFYFSIIFPCRSALFFHLFFNYFCGPWCVFYIWDFFFIIIIFFIRIKHACCRQRCWLVVAGFFFLFFS